MCFVWQCVGGPVRVTEPMTLPQYGSNQISRKDLNPLCHTL